MPRANEILTARAQERADKWRESFNPLRRLSAERARSLIESYLTGAATDLMWALASPMTGVETSDPDYRALIERTLARLLEMDWEIRTAADAEGPAAARAETQAKALREAYEKFDELYAAIGHLAMAPYRGWAHVEVDYDGGNLNPVEPWNVVRDGLRGGWAYNPEAKPLFYESLPADLRIDPERHWWLIRTHPRPVGGWALMKWFYQALSTRDWAAFVNIYGIPGGVVIGPPNVPEGEEEAFRAAAADIARGGEGYLPHGSDWKANAEARGQQPFQAWLDWLSAKLILAGTGGKLTMLNDPTGLGSGQSASHEETFDQIAKAEARKIGEVFNRQFDRRVLAAAGLLEPGGRPLAWWQLSAGEETDSGSIIEEVARLSQAGYRVEVKQVAEKTGYELTEKEPPGGVAMFNRRPEGGSRKAEGGGRRPEGGSSALRNRAAEAPGEDYRRASLERLAEARAEDLAPLLAAVEELEAAAGPEDYADALQRLRDRLAELLPEVTESRYADALEAVLGGALAAGGAEILGKEEP